MTKERPGIAATYRVQLNKDYTLWDLIGDVPYIHRLGVSHLYLSPLFESAPGSSHGYDVVDPNVVSRERGGEEAFAELDRRLRAFDPPMKIILDIVPNHMACRGENVFLYDVLKRGGASPYWTVFDFWVERGEKIELPVLGDHMSPLLDAGEIRVVRDVDRGWEVRYWDSFFPVREEDQARCHAAMKRAEIAALLDSQYYRLVKWTSVNERIHYRRFFDISGLIGLRVEDPVVFDLVHRKLFAMMDEYTTIAGVRVDHVDGMAWPAGYLHRLAKKIPLIWVEKILCDEETLPSDWPVAGTTGYEFIARTNDLMIDPQGFENIRKVWKEIQPGRRHFDQTVRESKAEALQIQFPAEVARLVKAGGQSGEFWIEATTALPVYRTYVHSGAFSAQDSVYIEHISSIIGAEGVLQRMSPENPENHPVLEQWQQLSGPAMAKGLEDTAHYRYTPLACLNEVGCEARIGSPGRDAFVDWLGDRSEQWPLAMNGSTTHDTKRGEDVRARLMALADIPGEWEAFVRDMGEQTARFRQLLKDALLPSEATAYFYLQTLVGAWPVQGEIDDAFKGRIRETMLKAAREAKLETNWLSPNCAYEEILERYVFETLGDRSFVEAVSGFSGRVMRLGGYNSLAALTLKLMAPGVPDIYQGSELWTLCLVDPDNRRPVDYAARRAVLDSVEAADPTGLFRLWKGGEVKLWLLHRLLKARGRHLDLLLGVPDVQLLRTEGERAGQLLAYSLSVKEGRRPDILVAVALNAAKFGTCVADGLLLEGRCWQGTLVDIPTEMLHCRLKNVLTGAEHAIDGRKASAAMLFGDLPVAVFEFV
ncbi:MAG: malto-oligosyltrehalose synthase [Alphaproteobacteria bacterium]|nr:malto-oligosyltrehalose synthase [Alphaproteobacteria bacterium]